MTLLSTTIWRLHEAMADKFSAYTTAFIDDLAEIQSELILVFAEINECCLEMQKMDTPGAVGWFFKKGRVAKLQQHSLTLKTSLVVMRTVLFHGKDHGIQRYIYTSSIPEPTNNSPNSPSDRLAESAPHTMSEDRAILESVFAKNRNAIMDLHNLEDSHSHQHSASTSSASHKEAKIAIDSDPMFSPGAHGRNLSAATGVEVPHVPDVLPIKVLSERKFKDDSFLSRRFSKRGVRLGVHMSILDLDAHKTEEALKKKWIAQAKTQPDSKEHVRPTVSANTEDSVRDEIKISVDDSDEIKPVTTLQEVKTSPRRSTFEESVSKARTRANSLIGSPMGKAMSGIIRRLSLSSARSGHRNNKAENRNGKSSDESRIDEGGEEDVKDGPVNTLMDRLNVHFTQRVLKTPDYNEEFENGGRA